MDVVFTDQNYGLAADPEIGSGGGLLSLKVVNLIISALFSAGGLCYDSTFFFLSC